MTNTTYKWPLILIAALIIGGIGYGVLTMQDHRSAGDKISDAYHSLSNGDGVEQAGRQLEDRTPGQKLGDAVKDEGDKMRDNTNSTVNQ